MNSVSVPIPSPDEPFNFVAHQEAFRAQERQRAASVLAALGALPPRPNLERYKRVAKERLKHRRESAPDTRLSLVQDELARENGFPNWPKFSHAISERNERAKAFKSALSRRDELTVRSALSSDVEAVVDVALAASHEDLWFLASVARHRSKAAEATLHIVAFALAQAGDPANLAWQLQGLQLQDFDWEAASTLVNDRRAAAEADPKRQHEVDGFDEALSFLATYEEFDATDGPFDMD